MKKLFLASVVALLLLTIGVLLVRRHHQNNDGSPTSTAENAKLKTEGNDMDTIITPLPPEDQEYIQELQNDIREAKAAGDEEWAAELEKDLVKVREEILNPPELPEDEHEWVLHWENEIRKAKKEGKSEQYIANLEKFRDIHLAGIAEDEKVERLRQEEQARFEALNSPEERITYYEEKLSGAEKALRVAKASGDASDIQWAEWEVEARKSDIKREKDQLAWIPVQKELDALQEWVEESSPKWIEKYRSFLLIEEIDGVERIVGVRTPAEIRHAAKELLSDSPPSESSSVPSLPDTQSTPKLQQTTPERSEVPPSSQGEAAPQQSPGAAMESIVNAQTQFQSWREDVDDDYLDVLVSQYMTPQELDQFFPTEADRQNLTKRTERLQQDVVSKVRKLVNGIPNATQAQKSKLARELVNANFDKDFADAVIEQLQLDEK
ncbi:MAG: hypothetical protein OXM61_11715 [Candidatus Poribacteria bacterium]|nr:hypothetical protein [Candidatus Poribacteria bacterium]